VPNTKNTTQAINMYMDTESDADGKIDKYIHKDIDKEIDKEIECTGTYADTETYQVANV